jgi:hypothetical protein
LGGKQDLFPKFAQEEEPSQILPIMILIVGFSFMAFGVYDIYQVKNFWNTAVHGTAKVLSLEERVFADGKPSRYIPQIAFKTENNRTVRVTIANGAREKGFYKVGRNVKIMYDPASPKRKVAIESPAVAIIPLSAFTIPGIGFGLTLIGLTFFRRRNGFG